MVVQVTECAVASGVVVIHTALPQIRVACQHKPLPKSFATQPWLLTPCDPGQIAVERRVDHGSFSLLSIRVSLGMM